MVQNKRQSLILIFFAALILGLFCGIQSHAHETIYPHVHPHPFYTLLEDFLLTGLWLAIWSAIAFGGYRLARRAGLVRQ